MALRYETINNLGKEIQPSVIKANQILIREREELILRKIEERDAKEEPNVLAYRYMKNIEIPMHRCVRQTLQETYGEEEDEWWTKGIPATIRCDCAVRREESAEREEPYAMLNMAPWLTMSFSMSWHDGLYPTQTTPTGTGGYLGE